MKEHLAIFDLDGTLYDTKEVNYSAYAKALSHYGAVLDREYFFSRCNGQYYKDFLPDIVPGITPEDMEDIHCRKKEAYGQCLDKAVVNRHLIHMIRLIRQEYYIALVTTASRKNVEDILRYFRHETLFDLILTQEDVTRKKPDPEGFLKTMSYFRIGPNDTIIYEDSDSGIEAALASGASVCRVLKS